MKCKKHLLNKIVDVFIMSKNRRVETMENITKIAHYACSLDKTDEFYDNICKSVGEMQNEGLKIEIQYQQGNACFSALIIGRGIM